MKGALLIAKKEFIELSKDRKTLFFTFVLPILLYPALFSMMGKLADSDKAKREAKPSRVALVDPDQVLAPLLKADPQRFEIKALLAQPEDAKKALLDQKLDLLVEVEAGAKGRMTEHRTFQIKTRVDESEKASELALKRLKETLKRQDALWVQARLQAMNASMELAEPSRIVTENVADMALQMGKLLGTFLPYMVMLMMFSGAMQHGIHATAGEKERGTLLSLLTTRISRTQIILGKQLSIFAVGVASALTNLLTMGLYFGSMAKSEATASTGGGITSLADPGTLALTFLLLIPMGFAFAGFITLMGTQARNSREAGTALMPGLLVVIMLSVMTMAPGIDKIGALYYVPIINVSLAIRKLFGQQFDLVQYMVALSMTLGMAGIMTWISTRLLNRESALFRV